jgi:hypothetical protein
MGAIRFSRNPWMVLGSSRKSSLVPTRMIGMFGAWWEISGYHYVSLSVDAYPTLIHELRYL